MIDHICTAMAPVSDALLIAGSAMIVAGVASWYFLNRSDRQSRPRTSADLLAPAAVSRTRQAASAHAAGSGASVAGPGLERKADIHWRPH